MAIHARRLISWPEDPLALNGITLPSFALISLVVAETLFHS